MRAVSGCLSIVVPFSPLSVSNDTYLAFDKIPNVVIMTAKDLTVIGWSHNLVVTCTGNEEYLLLLHRIHQWSFNVKNWLGTSAFQSWNHKFSIGNDSSSLTVFKSEQMIDLNSFYTSLNNAPPKTLFGELPSSIEKPEQYKLITSPVDAVQWKGDLRIFDKWLSEGNLDLRLNNHKIYVAGSEVLLNSWIVKDQNGKIQIFTSNVFEDKYEKI